MQNYAEIKFDLNHFKSKGLNVLQSINANRYAKEFIDFLDSNKHLPGNIDFRKNLARVLETDQSTFNTILRDQKSNTWYRVYVELDLQNNLLYLKYYKESLSHPASVNLLNFVELAQSTLIITSSNLNEIVFIENLSAIGLNNHPQYLRDILPQAAIQRMQLNEKEVGTSITKRIIHSHLQISFSYKGNYCYLLIQDRKKELEASKVKLYINTLSNTILQFALDYTKWNFQKSVNRAITRLRQVVDADRCYIFEYNWKLKTTSNIYESCRVGVSPQISNLQNIPFDIIPDWIEKHKLNKTLVIENINQYSNTYLRENLLKPQKIKSLIAVPIQNTKSKYCYGFIGFDWTTNFKNYSNEEDNLLRYFAELFSSKLNLEETLEELSNERLLQQSYQDLRPEGLIETDAKGHIIRINKAFASLLGVENTDHIDTSEKIFFQSCTEQDDCKQIGFQQLVKSNNCDIFIKKINGTFLPCNINITSIKNSKDEVIRYYITIKPEDSIQKEAKILISKKIKSRYISFEYLNNDFSEESIKNIKSHFNNIRLNPNTDLTFKVKEELSNLGEIIKLKANMKLPNQTKGEIFCGTNSLGWYTLHINRKLVFAEDNNIIWGIFENINEHINLEKKLFEHTKWLDGAQINGSLGYFSINLEDRTWSGSPNLFKIAGMEFQKKNKLSRWMDRIHPEDQDRLNKKLLESFHTGQELKESYRFLHQKKIKWIQVFGKVVKNEFNDKVFLGTAQDITEIQSYVEKVESKNKLLEQIAWEQSHLVRAPLSNVLAISDILLEEGLSSNERKEYLKNLKLSADKLDKVIHKIVSRANK